MPKRIGYKFELVTTDENCIEGVREMLKGKKRRAKYAGILTPDKKKIMRIIKARVKRRERRNAVAYYRAHVEEIGTRIAYELRTGTWKPQPYRERMIFDNLRGKWRRLRVPCLYDQCVHHAVMRQTVPDIMARKYYYDCGSVPKAGQARAVDALNRAMRRKKPPKYAASMDVERFYDICTADAIMGVLRRMYKDRRFLALHEQILASMGGVLAIGFYPSPWYGNLLLSIAVDREVKQNCKGITFYCRYADDMVILGNSKRALHRAVRTIMARLAMFRLKLKDNWQVYPTRRGVAFLSYRFFPHYTLLRKMLLYRVSACARSAARAFSPHAAMGMVSYKGILKRCNSYTIRKERIDPYTNFKKCRRMIRYVSVVCRICEQAAAA